MKRQGIDYKLSEEKTSNFLERVFRYILNNKISNLKRTSNGILNKFSEIYLEDSSLIQILDVHKDKFKGAGRSLAGVRINFLYSVFHQNFIDIDIFPGNQNDQKNSKLSINKLKENSLILRDLGYFKLSAFRDIINNKGYFLSRYLNGTKLRKTLSGKLLKINDLFKEMKRKAYNEFFIYLGAKEKLPVRIIIHKTPKKEYLERIRKISKKIKDRKKKEISKDYKERLKYSIFITNIPKNKLEGKYIGTLYKYRWEIENIIKELKSLLDIDSIKKVKCENKLKSILYARLIMALFIFPFKNIVAIEAKKENREISNTNLIKYLSNDILFNAIKNNSFIKLIKNLMRIINLLYKEKRKRKTIFQQVDNSISFNETFNY
jgi:hypothetical protein